MRRRPRRPEVLIVGGGPAGLVAALALRRAGREVVLLERRSVLSGRERQQKVPLDKPCGEGLMPDAVAVLERLGVDLDDCGRPFRGIAWIDGELRVDGRFPDRPGRGVRRLELHRRLWRAAEHCAVELRDGEKLLGAERQGAGWRLESRSGSWRPRWVVAADGLRSPLRRMAALDRPPPPPREQRYGVRRHFALEPWSDRVEVYWQRGVEAYVTPIGAEEVGVALLFRPTAEVEPGSTLRGPTFRGPTFRGPIFDRLLGRFPALEQKLARAEPTSQVQGTGPLYQRVRGVTRGDLALIGDASGYLDAITGEGMAVAFAQALLLERALRRGSLAAYRRAVVRLVRRPNLLTRLALVLSGREALRRRVLAALVREPRLFDRILALHVGDGSGLGIVSSAVRLGWRLAWLS